MIVEGIECEDMSVIHTGIAPGNLYLAKRNTGWHLLTCKKLDRASNLVIPMEIAYPYGLHECFKVRE